MEKEISKPRELYADLLRIVAAFLVVFQHTATSAWYTTKVETFNWFVLHFYNSLSRAGVGIFFMISGAFLLSSKKEYSVKKILTHNASRLFIILFFWVCIYGFINTFFKNFSLENLLQIPLFFFTKPPTHLWFLYVLLGLYLLVPLVRIFTANASEKIIKYALFLFFIFGLTLPTLFQSLKIFYGITIYKNLNIAETSTFLGFFLTGFFISTFSVSAKVKKRIYAFGILSWLISLLLSAYVSYSKGIPHEYFLGNFRPTTYLTATAFFLFFHEYFKNKILKNTYLKILSDATLGIYLIHPIFIKIFYALKFHLFSSTPIITVPACAVLFFTLSFLSVLLLKKLKIFNRFI